MFSTTDENIINGSLVIEAFKTIQPSKPNYEEVKFSGMPPVM